MTKVNVLNYKREVFNLAGKYRIIPDIDAQGCFVFYYHQATVQNFLDEVAFATGLTLFREEQFIQIDDADRFAALLEQYATGLLSSDRVYVCQPWMRSIKDANLPCYKKWDDLIHILGDTARYCPDCENRVYLALTGTDILRHVQEKHCVAFFVGDDVVDEFVGVLGIDDD
ncbi:MAG: hypothetical protein OEZ39_16160 [Gammaproteobacteria bacterium]|nr:hypothetical protein [Gammaproteobacteria bacterium]MDH5653393.1 hypothetical protein [Gammaproteobacteria bacterium]